LAINQQQVQIFEEDGVIMIRGAMKEWVEFLQGTTDNQIERPHVWSLVGRMSGMYDYIQRNMWMTNDGFRDFLYYSPLGHIISQLGRTEEVRCTTDMLLVNPNKGFGWHQDNQNGPIDFPDAIRWWVAMDRCGEGDFGAPEYLLGSHKNGTVSDSAVFVNRKDGDLPSFLRSTKFVPEPGDLIVWNARTIHRIVAPPNQQWTEGTQRRAIGGTMARAGATYLNKGGASGISDLAGHTQEHGQPLGGPYFPRIYPNRVPEEEAVRKAGQLEDRSIKKMGNLAVTLASNAGKYVSFTKVVGKKD
jgi:ectoine hydroxylase-related dioxygenase (phytanoyl-CoA dioxygenase family)